MKNKSEYVKSIGMPFYMVLLLVTLFLFSSCCDDDNLKIAPPKITGLELKGDWLMEVEDGNVIIFNFNAAAKIQKTIITPGRNLNTYRNGTYIISGDNIIMSLKELYNDDYLYVEMPSWVFQSLEDGVLKVKEKDVQRKLFKVSQNVDIDISNCTNLLLSEIVGNNNITEAFSYDTTIVRVDENFQSITGVSDGITFVRITMSDGYSMICKVNVSSAGIDAIDRFHKALGCTFSLLEANFGEPSSIMGDDCWTYRVNDCRIFIQGEKKADEYIVTCIIADLSKDYSADNVLKYMNSNHYFIKEYEDGSLCYMNKNCSICFCFDGTKNRYYIY